MSQQWSDNCRRGVLRKCSFSIHTQLKRHPLFPAWSDKEHARCADIPKRTHAFPYYSRWSVALWTGAWRRRRRRRRTRKRRWWWWGEVWVYNDYYFAFFDVVFCCLHLLVGSMCSTHDCRLSVIGTRARSSMHYYYHHLFFLTVLSRTIKAHRPTKCIARRLFWYDRWSYVTVNLCNIIDEKKVAERSTSISSCISMTFYDNLG